MMKSGAWPVVELGDYVDLLTGFPFKSGNYTTNPTDVRLLRGDNVGQGRLRWDDAKRYPANLRHEYAKFELDEGDVILAMDRPWIEAGLKFAWVTRADRPALLVQRVSRLRGKAELNTTFLRYVIGSPQFTEHVQSITTGVNVPHISGRDISRYRFPLPPLDVQHAVAACLSAYDDLIENNTRRIAILEEMARRIFEEWFVRFRAPGCEDLPLVESELGSIPKGWQVCTLSEFVDTQYGYTTSSSDNGIGPQFLRGMDLNKRSYIDWSQVPNCAVPPADVGRYALKRGDIVIVRMADPGKVGIVEQDVVAVAASYLVRLDFDHGQLPPQYLFHLLTGADYQRYVLGASNGTTRKSIPAPVMTSYRFARAPAVVLSAFANAVDPIRQLLTTLVKQNSCLRAQRDLLLPKLISGEIDLTEAAALPQAAE